MTAVLAMIRILALRLGFAQSALPPTFADLCNVCTGPATVKFMPCRPLKELPFATLVIVMMRAWLIDKWDVHPHAYMSQLAAIAPFVFNAMFGFSLQHPEDGASAEPRWLVTRHDEPADLKGKHALLESLYIAHYQTAKVLSAEILQPPVPPSVSRRPAPRTDHKDVKTEGKANKTHEHGKKPSGANVSAKTAAASAVATARAAARKGGGSTKRKSAAPATAAASASTNENRPPDAAAASSSTKRHRRMTPVAP